jgi:hypothetical protein
MGDDKKWGACLAAPLDSLADGVLCKPIKKKPSKNWVSKLPKLTLAWF